MSGLRLRGRTLGDFAIMAVVNRTPDSFFDRGATYGFEAALAAVDAAVAEGADIVDMAASRRAPVRRSMSRRSCDASSASWRPCVSAIPTS